MNTGFLYTIYVLAIFVLFIYLFYCFNVDESTFILLNPLSLLLDYFCAEIVG